MFCFKSGWSSPLNFSPNFLRNFNAIPCCCFFSVIISILTYYLNLANLTLSVDGKSSCIEAIDPAELSLSAPSGMAFDTTFLEDNF